MCPVVTVYIFGFCAALPIYNAHGLPTAKTLSKRNQRGSASHQTAHIHKMLPPNHILTQAVEVATQMGENGARLIPWKGSCVEITFDDPLLPKQVTHLWPGLMYMSLTGS
jgi:hypothetical protein